MSNKLTKEKLDELILEVINIKVAGREPIDVKRDLFDKNTGSIGKIRNVANVNKPKDGTLTDKDFLDAFKRSTGTDDKDKQDAEYIRQVAKRVNAPLEDEIEKIYNTALGRKPPQANSDNYKKEMLNWMEAEIPSDEEGEDPIPSPLSKLKNIEVTPGQVIPGAMSDELVEAAKHFIEVLKMHHATKYSVMDNDVAVELIQDQEIKILAKLNSEKKISDYNFAILNNLDQDKLLATYSSLKPYLEDDKVAKLQKKLRGKKYDKATPQDDDDAFPGAEQEREQEQPFGDVKVTYGGLATQTEFTEIAKGVRPANLKVDPTVLATVDAIEGQGLIDKLVNLSDFVNNIDERLKDDDIGQISSMVRMLGFLTDMVTEYESSAAGTVFETFLAMMGKGFIIGGQGGATDVAAFSKGSPIYYSAKLVSSGAIGQSNQENIGLSAVISQAAKEKSKQGLIYIIGYKTDARLEDITKQKGGGTESWMKDLGQADNPKAIALIALRLQAVDDKVKVTALKGDGTEYGVLDKLGFTPENINEVKELASVTRMAVEKKYFLGYIPVFHQLEDTTRKITKTGAVALNEKVTDFGSDALKSLRDAFANIKMMESLSQEHSAKIDKAGPKENAGYIVKIQKEYSGFKTNYNNILKGKDTEKTKIKENKNKSVKTLTD